VSVRQGNPNTNTTAAVCPTNPHVPQSRRFHQKKTGAPLPLLPLPAPRALDRSVLKGSPLVSLAIIKKTADAAYVFI